MLPSKFNLTAKIVVILVIIIIFVFQFIKLIPDYKQAKRVALNELNPNTFDDLVFVVEKKQSMKSSRLKSFLHYFQEVTRLSPERADVIGMQGFCFYLLGDNGQAISAYEKASELLPSFNSFHYNLAVLYFKTGQYEKAAGQLEKFFASDPKESVIYILSSSKIYAYMMLTKMNVLGKSMEIQVKDQYQKAYQLMLLCQHRVQTGNSLPGEEELLLESF